MACYYVWFCLLSTGGSICLKEVDVIFFHHWHKNWHLNSLTRIVFFSNLIRLRLMVQMSSMTLSLVHLTQRTSWSKTWRILTWFSILGTSRMPVDICHSGINSLHRLNPLLLLCLTWLGGWSSITTWQQKHRVTGCDRFFYVSNATIWWLQW